MSNLTRLAGLSMEAGCLGKGSVLVGTGVGTSMVEDVDVAVELEELVAVLIGVTSLFILGAESITEGVAGWKSQLVLDRIWIALCVLVHLSIAIHAFFSIEFFGGVFMLGVPTTVTLIGATGVASKMVPSSAVITLISLATADLANLQILR